MSNADPQANESHQDSAPLNAQDELTLKWGTLKGWGLHSPRARELMQKYLDIGVCMSAMFQKDTPEQKDLLCQIIDACNCDTIYLDWDGKDVSKEEAKEYIRNYGKPEPESSKSTQPKASVIP